MNSEPSGSSRPKAPDLLRAYDRLCESVRERLHAMKWTALRPVQEAAIHAVFDSDDHIVISAATASGKTEAAFLPIVSEMASTAERGVAAMYVGPLKALINDQFRRIGDLCARVGIPVFKWHGDVASGEKDVFLRLPSGILLITPESIESLFVNHADRIDAIFGGLRFVVIDELHSFIGSERGVHLKSLLCRIARRSAIRCRIVGLSATLGGDVREWLVPGAPESVRVITDENDGGGEIRYLVKGYSGRMAPGSDAACDEDVAEHGRLVEDIVRFFRGRTALLFGNSRSGLEFYADECIRAAGPDGGAFRVHHGSLSRAEREETEASLQSGAPTVAFCTGTLEMGIDVGNVALVGQIDCPWSVNSLIQRRGRSGRREGEPASMVLFAPERALSRESDLVDRLFPDLLRAVAMSELANRRRAWIEPPETGLPHYSTLIHQIMSVIAETGGARADDLYERLVSRGAFVNVDSAAFVSILRALKSADVIEQTPEGTVILGLLGEKIVRNYGFYASFASGEEAYDVICGGERIGSIPKAPDSPGCVIVLAGKRWIVTDIDDDRGALLVKRTSRSGAAPLFSGEGAAEIHAEIRRVMKQALASREIPVWLDPKASEMLRSARDTAERIGLPEREYIAVPGGTLRFTWTASKTHRTLLLVARHCAGLTVLDREGIALFFPGRSPDEIRGAFGRLASSPPAPERIAERIRIPQRGKFDRFVPEALLVRSYAAHCLDNGWAE